MKLLHAVLAGIFFVATSVASAAIIVVDADAYTEGTDISLAFPGVTLSAVGGGFGNGPSIFAVNPSTKTEPFTASTGSLTFGTDSASFPHLFREPGFSVMRVDFASATDFVSLDFIGNDAGGDTGLLRLFDSADNLLGSLTTASLITSQVGTLSFLSGTANIAYILASGDNAGSSIGIDNLQYRGGTVPEPATLGLLGLGLVGIAALRRRRIR